MQSTLAPVRPGDTRVVPSFAAPVVVGFAVVVVLAHLAAGVGTEYYLDEVYMLGLARHPPAWGYADQPPLAPLLAWLCDRIAPGSMLVLRIPPALATGAAVVVAALTARELGGDRRAQMITAVATAGGLWLSITGHFLSPYALEPVEWGLLFLVLLRWSRTGRDGLLVWLGVVVGIGVQTKFQILLLAGVLVVALLVLGPRRMFTRPLFWVGGGVAVLLAAPTLVWQAVHGWPQLRMGAVVAAEAQYLSGGRPGVAAALIVFAGVSGTYLLCYGLWRLLRDRELRFVAIGFLVLFVVFVVTLGRQYYLDGYYPVVIAAGAVGLQRRRERGHRRWRWAVWPASVLTLAGTVAGLALAWQFVNPPDGSSSVRFTAAAGDVYHRMSPQDQGRTAVYGESYIVSADLDARGPQYGLPLAYGGNRGYGYLDPPPDQVDQVLYVGREPSVLAPFFGQVRVVAPIGDGYQVWLLTGRNGPWTDIWPRTRTLVVS